MNKEQFIETYCRKCGTQRCKGIDDEEFSSGCLYRWNLDGVDAAAEIKRLNDKIMELAGKLINTETVRYGEWIVYEQPYGMGYSIPNYNPTHYCSNCKGLGWEFYGKCPHCGARMDGGKKE